LTSLPENSNGDSWPVTPILHNLVLFSEVLRGLGLDVGSGNMLDLIRATEYTPLGRRQDFRQAARSILVHRKRDIPLFDEAFDVFWRKPASGQSTYDLRSMGEQRRFRQPQVGPPPISGPEGTGEARDEDDDSVDRVDLTKTYSVREVLRQKDFSQFTPQEVEAARGMMARLSWNLGHRQTRRQAPGPGAQLDLRRTLRGSLRFGGEMLELSHREPRIKPRPLVLICDVSGSMERYTRMLLHFIHSVAGGLDRVEAFLFATRLTRITRYLDHRGVDQTVNQVSKAVPDWAGGTRIGEALKTFNFQWLRRVVRGGAVVLVISDGWDRGEPEMLAKEMSRLQRSCHRLIWLNPLLGSQDYQPLTRGMQAALPYIDDFMPVNNLDSLEALGVHLNGLEHHRRRGPQTRPSKPEESEASRREGPPDPSGQDSGKLVDPPTFRHPLWGRQRR
jgi:uncharacterized protein with von Willebrand factor type A (vWA) domain